jgi:hypothetical protein
VVSLTGTGSRRAAQQRVFEKGEFEGVAPQESPFHHGSLA